MFGVHIYYQKLILMGLLPIAAALGAGLVWWIAACIKKNKSFMKVEYVSTLVILGLLIHPNIVNIMFSAFSCKDLDDGVLFCIREYSIECWTDNHTLMTLGVALPCLVIWGLGIPGAIMILVVRNKTKLQKVKYKIRYGYVYNGYRESVFYWEFVILYRKMMIISIAVFLA